MEKDSVFFHDQIESSARYPGVQETKDACIEYCTYLEQSGIYKKNEIIVLTNAFCRALLVKVKALGIVVKEMNDY